MKILYETATLLAYFHPQPSYPFHVILVPKSRLTDLQSMDVSENSAFIKDIFSTTQMFVADYQLEESGYRLIVNGGENQDFPILHFHLISDKAHQRKETTHE